MIPLTTSTQSIDGLLRDTARSLFQFISPKIVLIGVWDDHYARILQNYRWATHSEVAPVQFDADLALIVVNNRALFNQIITRVSDQTAVLFYDEHEFIPISERNLDLPHLLCYLHKISPKYLPGHVRVLLQLQKAFVCVEDGVPYLLISDEEKQHIRRLIRTLDQGEPGFVIVPQVEYFFKVFRKIVQLSHYESVRLVKHPDQFEAVTVTKPTTLVLQVKSKDQFNAYQTKPLNQYSIIYAGVHRHRIKDNVQFFNLPELGMSEDTFLLSSYYESLKQNLADKKHRTRFIQRYSISEVMKRHRKISTYLPVIRALFDAHSVKFRNIPIRVVKANYCVYPLDDLLGQFHDELKHELLNQTDHSLYSMEMVSGTVRSTLMVRYHMRKGMG